MRRISNLVYRSAQVNALIDALNRSSEVSFESNLSKMYSTPSQTVEVEGCEELHSLWPHLGDRELIYTDFCFTHSGFYNSSNVVNVNNVRDELKKCSEVLACFKDNNYLSFIMTFFDASFSPPTMRGENPDFSAIKVDYYKGEFRILRLKETSFFKAFVKSLGGKWNSDVILLNKLDLEQLNCAFEKLSNLVEQENCDMVIEPEEARIYREFNSSVDTKVAISKYIARFPERFNGRVELEYLPKEVFANGFGSVSPLHLRGDIDILLGEFRDLDGNVFALYQRVLGEDKFRLIYEDVKEYGSTFEPFEKLGFKEE